MDYQNFLNTKRVHWAGTGAGVTNADIPTPLYGWQSDVVRWALKKERACIFADCGLGKTFMQLAWADALPGRVLILAPLCVAEQTVEEGRKIGIDVRYAMTADDGRDSRIVITNYERISKFDPAEFVGIVLDESSILKSFDGKTRTTLIEVFTDTPYRLCCTATPSPNDIAELANHSEFLGLMTRPEFLATWFVHDDTGWRMKHHAVKPFYEWMASWAISFRKPSDLGYNDERFILPELRIIDQVVRMDGPCGETLFPEISIKGIKGRLSARRGSVESRVARIAEIIAVAPGRSQWLIWCGLNVEADAMVAAVSGARQIAGSNSYQEKTDGIRAFLNGDINVLVTKPKILGFGMNFQQCHQMAFLGLSDSYESYYQCIRRCWRFGQQVPVDVHVVVSEAEKVIVANVRRKEADATCMTDDLLKHIVLVDQEEATA